MNSALKTVALIGLGRAGRIHLQNINTWHQISVKYIVDADVESVAKFLSQTGHNNSAIILSPEELDRVWSDADVVAVFVTSPTPCHENQVRAALQHKKSVFCEKPLADTTQQTKELYDLAEQHGLILHCSFNRRFDPSVTELRRRVQSGDIGRLLTLRSTSRDSPLPHVDFLKVSNGILHDCAIHDIDVLMWIVGELPTEVFVMGFAASQEIAAIDDLDTVLISLRFPCGAVASIDACRHSSYGYDQRVEVHGLEGMLCSQNQLENSVACFNRTGIKSAQLHFSFPQRYRESYQASLAHFFEVLDGRVHHQITKSSTVAASHVVDCCEESRRTGRPVKVFAP